MLLVGLNGKKGSGKDTAGVYLVERHGFERKSFADVLKVSAAACFGIAADVAVAWWDEMKNLPEAKVKVQLLDFEPRVDITVRQFLQFYGTEAHRDIFGADFWTKQLIDGLDPEGRYVITDARFVNECSAVRGAGGTIVVLDRPGVDSADDHASEADLPADLVDTVLYNRGSIEDLHKALDAYVAITDGPLTAAL